jgi:hypothetical protein
MWSRELRSYPNISPNFIIHECSLPCIKQNPPLVPILSQTNPVHTNQSYILRSILTLSSYLRLRLPIVLFPSGFLTKIFYAILFSPMNVTCPAHVTLLLDFIISITFREKHLLRNSYYAVSSNLLPLYPSSVQVLSSASCSGTRSVLFSYFNVRDQISHPYKIAKKIRVLYIITFRLLNNRREDNWFWTEWKQALPRFNLLLSSISIKFCFITASKSIWTVPHFQRICSTYT